MSPALLDSAATAHITPQNTSLNGQFSYLLSFSFSGFPSKSQSVPMNPSNIGNQTSGFSNYSNSNQSNSSIDYNTSFVRSAPGSSRPRFVKARRQSNSQNLRPTAASDARLDSGFNPFRAVPENSVPSSAASQIRTSVSSGSRFGKSGSEAFVSGANRVDSGVSTSMGRRDSSGGLEKEVLEEMNNLKIQSENAFLNVKDGAFNPNANNRPSSSLSGRSGSGGFVFGSGHKKSSSIDESIAPELPEEMRKLNIGGPGNSERIQKIRDVRFNLSVNDTTKFGFGSGDNVDSSLDRSVEAELPNELKNKCGIKEPGQLDGGSVVFGSGKKDGARSLADRLSEEMKNLNVKDSLNTNSFEKNEVNIKNNEKGNTVFGSSGSTGDSYGGRKETLLSRKMEKLILGSGAGDLNRSDAGPSSSRVFVKEKQMGHFGDMSFHDLDKSVPTEFTFQVGMQGKEASGSQVPLDQPKDDAEVGGNVASSSSFSSSDTEFSYKGKQDGTGLPFVEFKTPKPKANLFSGLNRKMEFSAKRESIRDTGLKKKSGKLKNPTPVQMWPGQDFVSRQSGSQENPEAFESYSPMDISPYQEALADNHHSRENSATSDESFRLDSNEASNSAAMVSGSAIDEDLIGATNSAPVVSSDAIDEDLIFAAECLNINEGNSICQEAKVGSFEYHFDKSVGAGGPKEESVSVAETESFKSAAEEVDYNSDDAVTSRETESIPSSNVERHDSDGRTRIGVGSSSEDISGFKFTFAASSAAQGQTSASKRHPKKINLLKGGHDMYDSSTNAKVSYASSSVNLFPFSGTSLPSSPGRGQKGNLSTSQSKVKMDSEIEKRQEVKQESAATVTAQEACEKWRQRSVSVQIIFFSFLSLIYKFISL